MRHIRNILCALYCLVIIILCMILSTKGVEIENNTVAIVVATSTIMIMNSMQEREDE